MAAGDSQIRYPAPEPPAQEPAALAAGECCAWPLSAGPGCAGDSRRFFRSAAAGLGLPADLIYDGMTMTSELAANTLHAQPGAAAGYQDALAAKQPVLEHRPASGLRSL